MSKALALQAKVQQQLQVLRETFEKRLPDIALVLQTEPERKRFLADIIVALQEDTEQNLPACDPNSIIDACIRGTSMGLRVGKRYGHYWLIPMEVHKDDPAARKWVVRFQLGVEGLRVAIYRFPGLKAIRSVAVRRGDTFTQLPNGQVEYIKTTAKDPGPMYAAFCEFYIDGLDKPIVYVAGEYELERSKTCAATKSFWNKHPEEMGRRVPILLGAKDLPKGDNWQEIEAIRDTEIAEFEDVSEVRRPKFATHNALELDTDPAPAIEAPKPTFDVAEFRARIALAKEIDGLTLSRDEYIALEARVMAEPHRAEALYTEATRLILPPL